jgi:hypothetical protein
MGRVRAVAPDSDVQLGCRPSGLYCVAHPAMVQSSELGRGLSKTKHHLLLLHPICPLNVDSSRSQGVQVHGADGMWEEQVVCDSTTRVACMHTQLAAGCIPKRVVCPVPEQLGCLCQVSSAIPKATYRSVMCWLGVSCQHCTDCLYAPPAPSAWVLPCRSSARQDTQVQGGVCKQTCGGCLPL